MKNGPRPGSALGGPRSALGGGAWREEDVAHVIEGAPVGVVGVSRADGPLRTSGKPAASRRPATLSSPTTTASCSCRPGRPARCWPPRARTVRSSGARLAGSGKARRCASRPPSMITWPGAPLTRPAPSGSTCAAPAEPSKNRSPRVPGLPAGRKNNPATVPAKKTTVSLPNRNVHQFDRNSLSTARRTSVPVPAESRAIVELLLTMGLLNPTMTRHDAATWANLDAYQAQSIGLTSSHSS